MPKVRYGAKKGLTPAIGNNGGDPPRDDDAWRRNVNGHVSTIGLKEEIDNRSKIKLANMPSDQKQIF